MIARIMIKSKLTPFTSSLSNLNRRISPHQSLQFRRMQSNIAKRPEEQVPEKVRRRRGEVKDTYVVFDDPSNRHFWSSPTFLWAMMATGAIGLAYILTHLERVPVSNRRRFMAMSKADEAKMAKMAFNEIMQEYEGKTLPPNHPSTILVNKVAARLIPHSGMDQEGWRVFVIDEPNNANAFVLLGKEIFVFTGLLPITQDEAGLAAVLAHEIGHLIAKHGVERYSQLKLLFPIQAAMTLFVKQDMGGFSRIFFEFGVLRPFSRATETEADFIGLQLMSKACYDPKAAVGLWKRMSSANSLQPPQLISTHPSNETRIQQIQKWMPQAEQVRESNCGNTAGFFEAFKLKW
jgi:predicted Zn-dependent protease